MSSNKLLKRKRKISFAIFYNRQYLSFISSCSSRSRLCIKCSWTTDLDNSFSSERTAFSNKAFNITEIETEVKVLGLAKNSYGIFETPSTLTEEDFNPTIGDNDFGVKVESVEKHLEKFLLLMLILLFNRSRIKGP
jgi:hypothetical protein